MRKTDAAVQRNPYTLKPIRLKQSPLLGRLRETD